MQSRRSVTDLSQTILKHVVYKGKRFQNEAFLDYKPTETLRYKHYSAYHPPGVKRGFIKGETSRFLRTNSSEKKFPGGHVQLQNRT